jgi:CRP/FNR family transcriptional regulator, cyclic AMP receptor protein
MGVPMLRPRTRRANVLDEDRELAAVVPAARATEAAGAAIAGVLVVEPGTWDARRDAESTRGGYGLLLLDGLLVRRVGFGRRWGAELLGPGDLLRPFEHDGEQATLPFEDGWRVVSLARLAVLDRAWSLRMALYPDVGIALTARAMLRSRRVANTLAISQHPKLDVRLQLLLWELADRYGRVRPDGVHLELPLTHELLSHLAAAQRPSVSTALSRLAAAGRVTRVGRGWLLCGGPPDLESLEASGDGAHVSPI